MYHAATSTPPRSTVAPMDFEFTSRPKANWKEDEDMKDIKTPMKRPHESLNPPLTPLHNPVFGQQKSKSQNPFDVFGTPTASASGVNLPSASPRSSFDGSSVFGTPSANSLPFNFKPGEWEPPAGFSPTKAVSTFTTPKENTLSMISVSTLGSDAGDDVDMADPSPPRLNNNARRRKKAGSRSALSNGNVLKPSDISHHYTLNVGGPDKTVILLGYVRFCVHLALSVVAIYLLLLFIVTVQRDVQSRVSQYQSQAIQEIALCTHHWTTNNCQQPIPAMLEVCAEWETCRSRDVTGVGRAKVVGEVVGEVLDAFVVSISWKTLVFGLSSIAFGTVFINALMGLYSAKVLHAPAQNQQLFAPSNHLFAPTGAGAGYLSPAPTPSWGRAKDWDERNNDETPTRQKRRLG
ncbi:Di-sulfide bridge nucleocytoplasmic transport domain-containing protein [Mycena floridula]|nr:Di-sulfide bridge nucleocytoplasmic transport domain-containing protein [Mycena floridula]